MNFDQVMAHLITKIASYTITVLEWFIYFIKMFAHEKDFLTKNHVYHLMENIFNMLINKIWGKENSRINREKTFIPTVNRCLVNIQFRWCNWSKNFKILFFC